MTEDTPGSLRNFIDDDEELEDETEVAAELTILEEDTEGDALRSLSPPTGPLFNQHKGGRPMVMTSPPSPPPSPTTSPVSILSELEFSDQEHPEITSTPPPRSRLPPAVDVVHPIPPLLPGKGKSRNPQERGGARAPVPNRYGSSQPRPATVNAASVHLQEMAPQHGDTRHMKQAAHARKERMSRIREEEADADRARARAHYQADEERRREDEFYLPPRLNSKAMPSSGFSKPSKPSKPSKRVATSGDEEDVQYKRRKLPDPLQLLSTRDRQQSNTQLVLRTPHNLQARQEAELDPESQGEEEDPSEAVVPVKRKRKVDPKALLTYYSGNYRDALQLYRQFFMTDLIMRGAWPTDESLMERLHDSLSYALEEYPAIANHPSVQLSKPIREMGLYAGNQVRGRVKNFARQVVISSVYGLDTNVYDDMGNVIVPKKERLQLHVSRLLRGWQYIRGSFRNVCFLIPLSPNFY